MQEHLKIICRIVLKMEHEQMEIKTKRIVSVVMNLQMKIHIYAKIMYANVKHV